eukprot:CAMPEP_0114660906 /NCGR_PEP_ID=MMETSP0191-20121206/21238_1 /TAXON_ID=126664 /ORGANISM="Sorites sp." /LENGTH=219 /DNA_ID=CAMNT_0001891441 /DNA_START=98 /DNA_END=757 /DNA_ORIENTATION=-
MSETKGANEEIEKAKPQFIKIEELSPASVGFNCIVRQVGDIKTIINRKNLDGSVLKISEAIIADKTGCVVLSLRNDQIDMVKKGDGLILRNAKIDMVNNGYMRVAIDRWGLIEPISSDRVSDEPNLDNNLSEVEYELVRENNYNDNRRRNRRNNNRSRNRNNNRRNAPRMNNGGYGGNNRGPRQRGYGGGYGGGNGYRGNSRRSRGNNNRRRQRGGYGY